MIGFADSKDFHDIRDLWETCFPDETGFNEYFFKNIFDLKNTLVFKDCGEICAMLQMLPYCIAVGETTVEATYIYGACTAPEHRKKGFMAELLERSFEIDKAKRRAASILIPQEDWLFRFYRKFGYEPFFKVSRGTACLSGNSCELPERLGAKDIPELQRLYETLAPSCHVIRSGDEWLKQLSLFDALGKGVYGWFEDKLLTAYAFCYGDAVQEAAGVTESQFCGLLRELGTDKLEYVSFGEKDFLGCIKWYKTEKFVSGYMNLMLN